MRRIAGALLLLAALGACARPSAPVPPGAVLPGSGPPGLALTPVAFAELPGWAADRQGAALAAFRRSCTRFARLPAARAIGPSGIAGQARDWQAACVAAAGIDGGDDAAARAFFERRFRPYRLSAGTGEGGDLGFFTGYYRPRLAGARRPRPGFAVPLYRRPPGLAADPAAPYYSRAEIDAGALAGRGLELVWLADPVDAFFASVQGSAEIALAGGGTLDIGYAGSNGRAYVAIGRLLIEEGEIPAAEMSLQRLRGWLADHPDRAAGLMERNPRYIFFRRIPAGGPPGAAGVVLTPGRSLAVDPAFLPLGVPLFLDSVDARGRPLRRLLLAQDTGAAIKGPLRGDVFWGAGPAAEAEAGAMKSPGRLYLLLPSAG